MENNREVWKIVIIYVLFGSAWIVLSDNLLNWSFGGPEILEKLSIIKGLIFIAVTALLLYFLVARMNARIRHSKHALRESEDRFQFLVDNSSDCLVIIKANGYQRYVSRSAESMFGFTQNELEGRSIKEIIHPDDIENVRTAWESLVSERAQTVSVQYRHIHKNGGWVDCEAAVRNFLQEPAIAGVIASVRDITERKQSEIALTERNKFISTIIDNLPIGLAVNHIENGTLFYMNKKFEEIYGWPQEELPDVNEFFDKICPDEVYRRKIKTQFIDDIQSGDPKRMNWEGVHITSQDGDKKIINAKNIPLYEQELMISTVQDITEQRTLQDQLAQVQKLESVGRLAGGVAHDLNNLLTPVLGYSELLLIDLNVQDKRHEATSQIHSAGLRARELVQQLLAFSRKQVMDFKPVDINAIISSFENLLRKSVPEDIDFQVILKPSPLVFDGDIGQIEQVIMNLVVNAADCMSGGGQVTIETALVELDEMYAAQRPGVLPGKYIMLAVSDVGSGMDKETVRQIFEPFFSTKGENGTGLGLATVYGIVKQHKGNIWVYSEVGWGTTVKVYLPVSDHQALKETSKNEVPDLKGNKTILIAEDNQQVRHLTRTVLQQHGYQVLEAQDGQEALDVVVSHDGPVHLLLSDIIMPGMNGHELHQNLVKKYPDIKVLYMSGYTDSIIIQKGILDKGVQFIQKPFTNQYMAAKVKEILVGKSND
ncbi:MAG: PAS domain S-box protein [Desulforhopalus sp.]